MPYYKCTSGQKIDAFFSHQRVHRLLLHTQVLSLGPTLGGGGGGGGGGGPPPPGGVPPAVTRSQAPPPPPSGVRSLQGAIPSGCVQYCSSVAGHARGLQSGLRGANVSSFKATESRDF